MSRILGLSRDLSKPGEDIEVICNAHLDRFQILPLLPQLLTEQDVLMFTYPQK